MNDDMYGKQDKGGLFDDYYQHEDEEYFPPTVKVDVRPMGIFEGMYDHECFDGCDDPDLSVCVAEEYPHLLTCYTDQINWNT